jgi:hypothetical protein
MTAQKHFKQLIRARMAKTGEKYSTARRILLSASPVEAPGPKVPWHVPGSIPATTGLRVLLTKAGVTAPHSKQPFSEAMLFGIAGGIGIGVFSFFYEKGNFASFFVAGRHLWHDDLAYLKGACQRLGAKASVKETGGVKAADKALREALAGGPCIAWVDAGHLPHRAMPTQWSGGGYHVVTVYEIDDRAKTALIGDLTDAPLAVSLGALAEARARIKKQKNRVLSLEKATTPAELAPLVRDGLRACHRGLTGEGGVKSARKNFSLEAIRTWGERLHGSKDKERWEYVFAPPRLWSGLRFMHDFIEHYYTGGALCRPLFADFLAEAAAALKDERLRSLGKRYADLGRQWSELADAALPDSVPAFRAAKKLAAQKAELTNSGARPEEIRACWSKLGELEAQVKAHFPLTDAECAALRADLQKRVLALYEAEVAAHRALGELLP